MFGCRREEREKRPPGGRSTCLSWTRESSLFGLPTAVCGLRSAVKTGMLGAPVPGKLCHGIIILCQCLFALFGFPLTWERTSRDQESWKFCFDPEEGVSDKRL